MRTVGDNTPVCTAGSYYGIGMSTFEPTIGITSEDNLYHELGNGDSGSTAIVQCSSLIGMIGSVEYECGDVYNPPTAPVANSNDPYVYVDPWTDRIMKFDMHALLGMTVEWSDNEGQSWTATVATELRFKTIKQLLLLLILQPYIQQLGILYQCNCNLLSALRV